MHKTHQNAYKTYENVYKTYENAYKHIKTHIKHTKTHIKHTKNVMLGLNRTHIRAMDILILANCIEFRPGCDGRIAAVLRYR